MHNRENVQQEFSLVDVIGSPSFPPFFIFNTLTNEGNTHIPVASYIEEGPALFVYPLSHGHFRTPFVQSLSIALAYPQQPQQVHCRHVATLITKVHKGSQTINCTLSIFREEMRFF